MNEQMKQVKFTVLVEDIAKVLVDNMVYPKPYEKVGPLNLIFEKNKANDYLKIILSKIVFDFDLSQWSGNYDRSDFNDVATKIVATKDFIRECAEPNPFLRNRWIQIKYIFWALFALSVDRSDYEEKVSLIADFAQMLKIDERTIRDITQVIKVILGEEEDGFEFQTDDVPDLFSRVLELFKN